MSEEVAVSNPNSNNPNSDWDALERQQAHLVQSLLAPWERTQADATLAAQQQWTPALYERGLQAYRANASMLAKRVLSAAYPTLLRLMGETSFDGLAVHFWRTHPPVKGDLAQWGEALEAFLRDIPELMQHEPYLPDVAALEWAMHTAQTAPDVEHELPQPLALIESEFPIISLFEGKDWDDVADQSGQSALVYRQGFKTNCVALTPEQVKELKP